MTTNSTPQVKDLSPIYIKTDKAHASGNIIFKHFNAIHNTLFATGSVEYASGHSPALYIDDRCVGNMPPICGWTINDDGALVIDNSNLSLNQGTIEEYRAEDFHESQQQHFRGLLDLIEYQLSITNEKTGDLWNDAANSFSIGGIAKHRDISSIRALLDFAGHLSPEIELGFDDEDHNPGTFYDWGLLFGNSKDPADVCVWKEIRAAWYCCFNIVDPQVETRVPWRSSGWETFTLLQRFQSRRPIDAGLEGKDAVSHVEETYTDGDDKDMMTLQRGMEKLNAEVKDGEETCRDRDYIAMVARHRGYGVSEAEAVERDYVAMVARHRGYGELKTEAEFQDFKAILARHRELWKK